MIRIVDTPSPNHGPRRPAVGDRVIVDMLVLHYTGMRTAEDALARLTESDGSVSAHWVIDEDGTVYRLVEEERRAWHAGRAYWAGEVDINSRSIGVEIVNPGHEFGYRPFPEAQMVAVQELCLEIVDRWSIPTHRVLGHSDVAPDRKEDPGELFPWARLAEAGVGLWPDPAGLPPAAPALSLAETRSLLRRVGYEVGYNDDQPMDAQTRSALTAFQRHWQPDTLTSARDPATTHRLAQIAKAIPSSEGIA